MKLHLRLYRETVRQFESKERSYEACALRHRVRSFQSCFVTHSV